MSTGRLASSFTSSLVFVIAVLVGIFLFPWDSIDWGTLRLGQAATITVSGSAKQQQKNEIAGFNAGVTVFAADKDTAVNEVNSRMNEILESVKWFKVDDASKLGLISNHVNLEDSEIVNRVNNCKQIINGGFYAGGRHDIDNTPIGYFKTENSLVNNFEKNSLFNGILTVNFFDTPRVTRTLPNDPIRIGLQTGPILIENGSVNKLSLVRDEKARRMVAAVTGENEIIFLTFYNPESLFLGPKLVDLPEIVKKSEVVIGESFADAINLDGGTASVFYNDEITLTELSPVGSVFCVKN